MTSEEMDALELTLVVSRADRWQLEISSGDPVTLHGSFVKIGRRPSGANDDTQLVEVHDISRTMSRTHARLMQVEGAWLIEDLKSANGVYVGDESDASRIGPGLHPVGDLPFWLGDIRFQIHDMSRTETNDAARDDEGSGDAARHESDATPLSVNAKPVLSPSSGDTGRDVGGGTSNDTSDGHSTRHDDAAATLSDAATPTETSDTNGGDTTSGDVTRVYVATGDTLRVRVE